MSPSRSDDSPPTDWRRRLAARLRLFLFRWKSSQNVFMISLAVFIGIMGGFGAVGFRYAIDAIQNLCWPPGDSFIGRVAEAHAWVRVVVPTLGGLCVGLIVYFFAREAKGHGVPEVMEAVAVRSGVIRPRVSVAKLVSSAITIGSGGSAGREGPIIQIGSAIGSAAGQILRVSSGRLRTFVGCGAAAGMAATFNAPIAGALFAGEVILGNFGAAHFGPIIISSVVGTAVARSILGNELTFDIPTPYAFESPYELVPYAMLGVVACMVGLLFVSVLHRSESFFEGLKGPEWVKPAVGGAIIGTAGIFLPQVMGVGYDFMDQALGGSMIAQVMLVFLFLKMFATAVTLGSGGSGGVFAPSLLLGAMTGGVMGSLAGLVLPAGLVAHPGAYALVGMGAVVAATTHAPITAIVIMFELTGQYEIILPLMIACTISTLLAMRLRRDSIYTIKLSARGREIRFGRELNVLKSLDVRSVMRTDRTETIPQTMPLQDLIGLMVTSPEAYFYVLGKDGRLSGVVSVNDLRKLIDLHDLGSLLIAADVAHPEVIRVLETETLDVAMRRFGRENLEELPVVSSTDEDRLVGTIHRRDVIAAYNREMFRRDAAGELAGEMAQVSPARLVEVGDGFGLLEVEAPAEFVGASIGTLAVRARHGVDVLLLLRYGDGPGARESIMPSGETVIHPQDRLLLFGELKRLRPFREF